MKLLPPILFNFGKFIIFSNLNKKGGFIMWVNLYILRKIFV